VSDDDEPIDVTGFPPPVKKAKTSSYFGSAKPTSSDTPISNGNTIAGPSRKPSGSGSRAVSAAPTHLQSYKLPRAVPAGSASHAGSAFDTFSYAAPEDFPRPSQERTPAQQAKHEAWHRKVVGGNLIPRRRSLALDDAAAAEARKQLGLEEDDGAEVAVVEDGDNSEEERQKAAEKLGDTLAAKYGAKTDAKGKGKAVSRKKKVEEVGPSGQTYTPLEKQYMEHKARNPDVLLMMEVGYKFK
jgi:DNA mismatch repair protein MSH3